jgi:hypothetical protein
MHALRLQLSSVSPAGLVSPLLLGHYCICPHPSFELAGAAHFWLVLAAVASARLHAALP